MQCYILYHGELIPEANSLYHGRMTAIGNILGFIIGIFATKLWKISLQIVNKKYNL